MSRQDQLLASLASGRRLCDDCLSDIAGVTPRQSVYQACTALRVSGLITRMTEACEACNRSKITNARLPRETRPSAMVSVVPPATVGMPASSLSLAVAGQKPWFWEGNVQARIVEHLKEAGISIISSADTSTREQGKDILAKEIDGVELWVSVKGFPENSPNVQARHWFAGALLDMALYRNQREDVRLALGFPYGFSTYENLIRRTKEVRGFLGFQVFWVRETGAVSREGLQPKPTRWSSE